MNCIRAFAAIAAICLLGLRPECPVASPPTESGTPQPADGGGLRLETIPEEANGVGRLLRVSDRIYSGTEPQGDAAFEYLAGLGVKVLVCVDGAQPQVATARKFELRYVHIPIAYDHITADAAAAITRVVREIEGPIYIHCHHGRHRGPAAAAIASIAEGAADGQAAVSVLETAGTSRNYPGLWRDVAAFCPPSPDAALPELVEVARVESLTSAMAQIDRVWDNLQLCHDAGWSTPADHPDIAPARESKMLEQMLRDVLADDDHADDPRFASWLAAAAGEARRLQKSLETHDIDGADRRFQALSARCDQCHGAYRDR